jgi:GPH family glycoside/pentoside/hexuronide:cation symporter
MKKLRKEFKDSLNSGIHGFCFSPYLEGQNLGDQLSREQIEKRMKVVAPHTKWVRSFSCTDGNELIPEVANKMGLKTLVGAWIDNNLEANEVEIQNLIKVAKAGHADMVSVGNECLLREELSEDKIITYINQVKEALPGVMVSYVDTYYQLHQSPKVIDACDVVLANCYPFWEGYDADHSSVYLTKMYEVIKEVAGNKKVIIAETGWPTYGKSVDQAEPSIENMMKYFIRLKKWSEQEAVEVFYFSSFDESWKARHEGDVGARWGLWNKNEQLKVN